jgi:hypothetical protein
LVPIQGWQLGAAAAIKKSVGAAAGGVLLLGSEVFSPKFGEFGFDDAELSRSVRQPYWTSQAISSTNSLRLSPRVLFAAADLAFGVADVVFEPVDPLEEGGLVVAASAAELGEGAEFGQFVAGMVEAPVCLVSVLDVVEKV